MHRDRLIVLATTAICACAAIADVKTFTGNGNPTGNWNVANNWNPPGIPSDSDRAVILSGKTCTVTDDRGIDTIDVQSGANGDGVLIIAAGHCLKLENQYDNIANTPDDSRVDGIVELSVGTTGTNGGNLIFDVGDHTVKGDGTIHLQKFGAIAIGYDITLTSELAAPGHGIRGDRGYIIHYFSGSALPVFSNRGIVAADSDYPGMEMGASVNLADVEGAEWDIGAEDTQMNFQRAASGLAGDFNDHCGSGSSFTGFAFYASIATSGTFTRNGGGLAFYNSSTFTYGGYAAGDCPSGCSCGNPVGGPGPTWTAYATLAACVCSNETGPNP